MFVGDDFFGKHLEYLEQVPSVDSNLKLGTN